MARPKKPTQRRAVVINHNAEITEEDVKDAFSIIQRDYYDDVGNVGDELIQEIKDGGIPSREDFHDALHQAVDGTARVIYTWQARLGLLATANDDAYFEEFGETLECDGSIPYEKLLFVAMERDVVEYMVREGCDPDDDDVYGEEDEEED